MSIALDHDVLGSSKKFRNYKSESSDIDLLNYSATRCESSSYDSDKSSGHFDLLLNTSEIHRLVRCSSNDEYNDLLSPSCGVAKKPGFYLKQDMKVVNKGKMRHFQEESDCVLDSLLTKVPSRDANCSHAFLRKDSLHDLKRVGSSHETTFKCTGSTTTDEDLSGSSDDEKDNNYQTTLLIDSVNQTRKWNRQMDQTRDDILSDEWLHSLNPRASCQRKDMTDPTSFSDQTLLRKEKNHEANVKGASMNDLTQPFYRMQRKVVGRVEKDLKSLGFSNETDVNWNALYFPKRRDVLRLIHYRLCNHINPDVVVVLDAHEFFCHRILLQSYSEYFDDLKPSDVTQRVDISNKNVTENAFLTIYTWMLSIGQSGFQLLTRKNILEVLLACQILKIKDLENQCTAFIENHEIFTEDTAYYLFKNASELKMKSVQTLMIPRVRTFFLVLVSAKDFLELPLENICMFLQSDHIGVHCELEVFYSGVRWLRHLPGRKGNIEDIMSCIRFALMNPLELVDLRNSDQNDLAEIVSLSNVQRLMDSGLAIAVKNTLSKRSDNKKDSIGRPLPRNWLGKTKTYKSYAEFLNFLKDLKENPSFLINTVNVKNNSSLHNDTSDYQKQDTDRNSRNHKAASQSNCDSGVNSSSEYTPSIETRTNKIYKYETTDVATNTCQELFDYNAMMPNVVSDLIEKQDRLVQSDLARLPQAKVSDPVILHRGNGPRLQLREQAAIVLQAAFKGHMTRLSLLKAIATSSSDVCKPVLSKEVIVPFSDTILSQLTKKTSSQTLSCLNSRTKLHEESTKNGSIFHLFQNAILIFGGLDPNVNLGPGNGCTAVYRYIGEKNKWDVFTNLPEPRYYHGVVLLKGKVYLAGGSDPRKEDLEEKSVCKTVWSLDPNSEVWKRETDMLVERKNFGLVAAGGYIYAIGGQSNDSNILSSVERYDTSTKKWSWVSSLEHGRTGAAVCKHNRMIWVAGGIVVSLKHQVNKHVECYDPKRDVWMSKSPLRFGRAFGSLVSLQGNLYLVGGASRKSNTAATSTPAIDIWDERNKEWKLKTELSIPRHSHSVACIGSQMVVLGGTTTMSMRCVTTVESWCVNRGTWIRGISSLPACLIGHATVTLPLMYRDHEMQEKLK